MGLDILMRLPRGPFLLFVWVFGSFLLGLTWQSGWFAPRLASGVATTRRSTLHFELEHPLVDVGAS